MMQRRLNAIKEIDAQIKETKGLIKEFVVKIIQFMKTLEELKTHLDKKIQQRNRILQEIQKGE